jgi:hypothetical protein
MRAVVGTVAGALLVFGASAAVRAATADVVIQAGHQGRPASCAPNHVHACNIGASNGTDREMAWTPIVADAVATKLRAAGYRVIRRPADYPEHDTARVFVAIHFDGAVPACASGTSVGFPATTPHRFIAGWEKAYRPPFRFVGENISTNEEHYYGFHKADAPYEMLVEYGEITCPAQAAWLRPRLRDLGALTATYVMGYLR